MHEYTISTYGLANLKKRLKGPIICRRCGRLIQLGDRVITHKRKLRLAVYHKTCYDSMFID